MIATEILAGSGDALFYVGAWREVEEVKGVEIGGGEGAGRDLALEEFLNRGIGDGLAGVGRSQGRCAGALAMTDGLSGDAVVGELVDEGTRKDKVEEGIDLAAERGVGGILPRCAPEDREDVGAGEEGAVAIGESRGGITAGVTRLARCLVPARRTGLACGTQGDDRPLQKRKTKSGPPRRAGPTRQEKRRRGAAVQGARRF